jgi:radical SAM-linked protein
VEVLIRHRVRLRFRKTGDLRWISHRDLVRTLERWFRRAGLELGMTEGFHPKPRMSFPAALAVGIAGLEEVMELELSAERTADDIRRALGPLAPPGLEITSAEVLAPGTPKVQVRRATYELPVPRDRHEAARRAIAALLASDAHLVRREQRAAPVDLRPMLDEIALVDDTLRFRVRVAPEGTARPREVLAAIGLEDLEHEGLYLTRTHVEIGP